MQRTFTSFPTPVKIEYHLLLPLLGKEFPNLKEIRVQGLLKKSSEILYGKQDSGLYIKNQRAAVQSDLM